MMIIAIPVSGQVSEFTTSFEGIQIASMSPTSSFSLNQFPISIWYNRTVAIGYDIRDGLFRPKNESTEENPQWPIVIRETRR
jgi:hypothetical protein